MTSSTRIQEPVRKCCPLFDFKRVREQNFPFFSSMVMEIQWIFVILRSWFLHMRNALFHKCFRTSAVQDRAKIAIIDEVLLFFQQHSSISSSMDSSHSAPYAPYSSNNISGYPGSGGTTNAGNPGGGGGGSRGITMNAIPATMTAAASSPVPSASPVLFSRPIMLAKQRNLLSQSSNSIPAALGMVRTKPTPPIRRAMTVGDRLGSVLGQDEAAKRITEFFKNYIVRFSVNSISNFVPNKWVRFSIKCILWNSMDFIRFV